MKKVLKVLTNKFLLTTIGFVVWMVYFDQNDWFTMQQKKKEEGERAQNGIAAPREARMKLDLDHAAQVSATSTTDSSSSKPSFCRPICSKAMPLALASRSGKATYSDGQQRNTV